MDLPSGFVLLLLSVVIFLLALVVGLIGNITGVGGGVMIILLLVYMFDFNPLDAAGLSLLTLVFSTMIGSVQNMRRHLVDMKLFSIITVIAVIGAIAGSIMANYVPSKIFKGIFSIILICLGLFSIYASHRQTRGKVEKYAEAPDYSADTGLASVIAGIVSGFIGIGIGGIMGTYLTAVKRSQPRTAIATIVAAALPVTIAGMALHFYYTGFINISYAPPLVVGAFVGGVAGSWVIRKVPQVRLRFFQGYIIIFFGSLSTILYVLTTYHY